MNFDIKFEDLDNLKQLGEGNFGKVYRADYVGTDVAVKLCLDESHLNKDSLPPGWDFEKYVAREVEMLKEARHPNIVQYMGMAREAEKYYIVTEFVPGGNLKEWIIREQNAENNEKLQSLTSLRCAYSFAIDICRALAYLHAHNIIHRDLKLENLLLTENMRVKVCDFGFSRLQPTVSKEQIKHDRKLSYCGTEDYMAPELILCMDYTQSIDIFSFGIVFLSLIMLTPPTTRVFQRVIPGFGFDFRVIEDELPEYVSKKDRLLITLQGCLEEDGNKRAQVKDILSWLKDLELDALTRIKEKDSTLALVNVGATISPQSSAKEFVKDTRIISPASSIGDLASQATSPTSQKMSPNTAFSLTKTLQRGSFSDLTGVPGPRVGLDAGVNPVRLRHDVPHRFSIVFSSISLHQLKCNCCGKNIQGFMHSHLQCDDCGFVAHKKCAKNAAPTCGLKASHLSLLSHQQSRDNLQMAAGDEVKKSMNIEL